MSNNTVAVNGSDVELVDVELVDVELVDVELVDVELVDVELVDVQMWSFIDVKESLVSTTSKVPV